MRALDFNSKLVQEVVLVRGSDPYLRDKVLSLFKLFIGKRVDASRYTPDQLVEEVSTPDLRGPVCQVDNSEQIKETEGFDYWLHLKEKGQRVVFVVTPGAVMLPHYVRVISRRGVIVDCEADPADPMKIRNEMVRIAAKSGKTLSPFIKAWLMSHCSGLMEMSQMISKISLGWANHHVSEEDLERCHLGHGESGEKVLDYMVEGRPHKAIRTMIRNEDWGYAPNLLAASMARGLLKRLMFVEVNKGRVSQAAQRAGIDQRKAPKLAEQCARIGRARLWAMFDSLVTVLKQDTVSFEVKLVAWMELWASRFRS